MKKAFYLIMAGVAIGLLVAPRKGSETWNKIKNGFEDWKDEMNDQGRDFVKKGTGIADHLKEESKMVFD